jgi:hypothetical protein
MGGACSTRNAYKIVVKRDYAEDLSVDGRIMLECILGKEGGKMWNTFIWLRRGTSGGPW